VLADLEVCIFFICFLMSTLIKTDKSSTLVKFIETFEEESVPYDPAHKPFWLY
jgi:hypothetical protein